MTTQPAQPTELVIKIPIAEWRPEWDLRGLEVTGVRDLPEGGCAFEFTAPSEIIQEMIAVQNKQADQKAKKTGLAAILQKMYDAAISHPGQIQSQPPLKNGMGIDMLVFNNILRMKIWRVGETGPSDVEWATTCKYFPVSLAQRDPERFTTTVNGQVRSYLRAAWNASDPADERPV